MQPSLTRFIAVDWSGAQSIAEQRRRIVAADWHAGKLELSAGRSREETATWLILQAERTPDMVVGLDFSFSFPEWFVRQCDAEAIEPFWECVSHHAEHWLGSCEPPFWGRPGKRCPEHHRAPAWMGYRKCEQPSSIAGHPKSTFQIGGAGAVGTGSLRGIDTLLALRKAGFSIWPFHEPALPCVVEIYPRSFTGPVAKSDPVARAAYLDAHLSSAVTRHVLKQAELSEDAFDALCSVIGMARQHDDFAALQRAINPSTMLEGAIFPGRALSHR